MAKFELEHTEGMRWIKVTLNGETVRAERGAMSHMMGKISMDTPLPSFKDILISFLSDESLLGMLSGWGVVELVKRAMT